MNEEQLLQEIRYRPEAFREIYAMYFPRVYAYVAYRVRRMQDAEDVVSEVFMRVVKNLDRFEYRGDGSFAAWLFRIAHNEVKQFYRHKVSDTVSLDELPEIQAHHLAPDQALARKEQFARLSALIAGLSERRREIVTLKFFGGLRNQEIARILDLNERTVASHLCRALDDLRQHYEVEQPYD